MRSDVSTERPFPFFDLPGELRDVIYDDLKVFKPALKKNDHAGSPEKALVQTIPLHIRLVSRRFKKEAESRVRQGIVLQINGHAIFGLLQSSLVPWAIEAVTNVELSLTAWCPSATVCSSSLDCRGRKDLSKHNKMTKHAFTDLRNIKALSVEINILLPQEDRTMWPNTPHGLKLHKEIMRYVDVPHMTSLRVHKRDHMGIWDSNDEPHMQWDKKNGWQALKG